MRIFVVIALIFGFWDTAVQARAQADALTLRIVEMETAYEEAIQDKRKEFRFVKRLKEFPERINAVNAVGVISDPPGAIAALHDPVTGRPLEACITPCELHVDNRTLYVGTFYKFGHEPLIFPLRKGDPFEKWLGPSVYDITRHHIRCREQFEARDRVDGDAKPCLRIPPRPPILAQKSGHCMVYFDINAGGRPINIEVKDCTEPHFVPPSFAAVNGWFFHPKIERGVAVGMTGVQNKLTFQIFDKDGFLVDETGKTIRE